MKCAQGVKACSDRQVSRASGRFSARAKQIWNCLGFLSLDYIIVVVLGLFVLSCYDYPTAPHAARSGV